MEAVLPADSLDDICRLLLHVTRRGVHLAQRRVKTAVLAFRVVQPVLPFQFACYLLAPVKIVPGVYAPAVLVHPDRHDMQMVAVDVLVLENEVRLVAEAHLLQILPRDVLKLRVRQNIVGMRIERDMHHRFLHLRPHGHHAEKVLHSPMDVHRSRAVIVDAVGCQKSPFRLVDFLPVVGKCAVQRVSYTDFCDHFSCISLESSTIRRLSFTSSTVCCSSL